MIRIQAIIDKKGRIETTVLDRSGESCTKVYNVTSRAGRHMSDEITGPDCDLDMDLETGTTPSGSGPVEGS